MVGIIYVYLLEPGMKYIIKHPTPENAGKIIYKTKSNDCFVYKLHMLDCPADKAAINSQPISVDK